MKNMDKVMDRLITLGEAYGAAEARDERSSQATTIRNILVLQRMQARHVMNEHLSYRDEERRLKRAMKKAEQDGVTFLPAVTRLKMLETLEASCRKMMAQNGELLMWLLDWWQEAGATYDDLLRFCGADYPGMRKRLNDFYSKYEGDDRSFSGLVFVHNLDYKNPRETGWIEDYVDAPLTHCIKEWQFDKLHNDSRMKAAAHNALMEVFPDIMDNAMVMRTDDDGVKRLYDKDGECVDTLGGDE